MLTFRPVTSHNDERERSKASPFVTLIFITNIYPKMADNVMKHGLVPKHVKLSDSEKEKFLKANDLTIKELPKIRESDPAITSLTPKNGDIIKIFRDSKTSGSITYYRVVING